MQDGVTSPCALTEKYFKAKENGLIESQKKVFWRECGNYPGKFLHLERRHPDLFTGEAAD